jgi:hypothetical protein
MAGSTLAATAAPAEAATATFQPGRIIDDHIFTDKNSMSVAAIQAFLNAKVPVCDTWHAAGTGAQGAVPPWKCLKDYYENPSTGANNLNGNPVPAGGITAAQIIWNNAQEFGINPKVILVTLQKENGLITDTWPYPWQYRTAMGFACPDTAACNPAYYGFAKQVYQGTRHLRNFYDENPNWTVPYKVGTRFVQYHPNAGCGGTNVNIATHGTAALYSYTPYQPNAASLAAGFGTGNSCSSYGNRNFYNYFTNWFGSPNGGDPTSSYLKLVGPISASPAAPVPGQQTSISFRIHNTSTSSITLQSQIVQCRLNTTTNCDPPWGGAVTLAADEQRTFTQSVTVRAGQYWFTPFVLVDGVWWRLAPDTVAMTGNALPLTVPPYVANMKLVGPIWASPAAPIPGQQVTVTYTVRNMGDKPAIYQNSLLQCRYNTYTPCDPAWNAPVTINPGAQQTFSNTFTVGAGTYYFTPYYQQNGNWYKYSSDYGIGNMLPLTVPPYVANLKIIAPFTSNPLVPVPGGSVTVTYTVQNMGDKPAILQSSILQCRYSSYTNCDPPWGAPITINPGAQHTFSNTFSSLKVGWYTLIPYYMQNGSWYRYTSDTPGGNWFQRVVR